MNQYILYQLWISLLGVSGGKTNNTQLCRFWRFCLFQAHCFAFSAWLGHNVIIKSIFQQQQAAHFSKQAPIKPNYKVDK